MATIDYSPPVARRLGGGDPITMNFPVAAGQTFDKFSWVYLNSGAVTECASDNVTLLGIAMADAPTTTGDMVPVAIAHPMNEFCMNVYHGTPASAVVAWTDIGTEYALYVSSGTFFVDVSDTGHDALQLHNIDEAYDIIDTYIRVWVHVPDHASQLRKDLVS